MKDLLLVLSSGRTGTHKLSTILADVPGMYAEHEGDPGFHLVREKNSIDPSIGSHFVEKKISFFKAQGKEHIAHTGHMAGEGFFEHFIDQGIIPNVIILRRPAREVALSMFKLNWIPGRNELLRAWYRGPDEKNVLPYHEWKAATSYQLCYWWALDTEYRIQQHMPLILKHHVKIYETTLNGILNIQELNSLLKFFNLSEIESIPQNKVNHLELYRTLNKPTPPDDYLTKVENEVHERTNTPRSISQSSQRY
jgi:hypothetical protein